MDKIKYSNDITMKLLEKKIGNLIKSGEKNEKNMQCLSESEIDRTSP